MQADIEFFGIKMSQISLGRELARVFAHSVDDLRMEKISLKDYYKHIKDIIYTSAFPSSTGRHRRE